MQQTEKMIGLRRPLAELHLADGLQSSASSSSMSSSGSNVNSLSSSSGAHSNATVNSESNFLIVSSQDKVERVAAAAGAAPPRREPCKSPVLVKYNYYDCSGARREQTPDEFAIASTNNNNNNNSNQSQHNKIQRQLSPSFRHHLDLIMRTASQQLEANGPHLSNSGSSTGGSPTSPPPLLQAPASSQQLLRHRRYKLSSYEQLCLRCHQQVYQMDKVGPLKDLTFYHQNCFKCRECGTKLTLKTYFNNQQQCDDREVYCHRHCPKIGAGKLDNQTVGIRTALDAPKVFEQPLGPGEPINFSQSPQLAAQMQQVHPLGIQHAIEQTRMQHFYRERQHQSQQQQQQHLLAAHQRLQYLEPKQKMLELRHRREEDDLFRAFQQKLLEEEQRIGEQVRAEWQLELAKLLDKYKRQLGQLASGQQSSYQSKPAAVPIQADRVAASAAPSQQMIDFERINLENTMTIKLDRKKETLKRKLKEFERQATAEMVEKQSREMLALVSLKLDEFKRHQLEQQQQQQQQQQRKPAAEQQVSAVESLASELESSVRLAKDGQPSGRQLAASGLYGQAGLEVPAPVAPTSSKLDLYNSDQSDEIFAHIDRAAISVAKEDQQSFTDLVHHLTRNCLSDVEKVRAIFRWVTVKNLNTMQFDSTLDADTPLGLLRGIKNGSESYHVLFKRLCSYAGLHCVVIKGYSKSAGYQPGLAFQGNRFRNSWNAVHVAGSWRFVQCNWGARHLVSVAVMQDKNQDQRGAAIQGRSQRPPGAAVEPKSLSPNRGRRGVQVGGGGGGAPAGRKSSSQHSSKTATTTTTTTRHLDSDNSSTPNDTLRYEYDDHYFLTDPDEFIYEFFPLNPEWQLVRGKPLTLDQFELLPFVRSLFFKYGLYFPQADIRSVLQADSSGAATVKIGMPTHLIASLIFHYNLKRTDSDAEHHDGVNLRRFVMQSVEYGAANADSLGGCGGGGSGSDHQSGGGLLANIVSFRVHLPEAGAYILDIFANSITPTQYITGEPMKFKSVCKFKIEAKKLKSVMIALPDCASGEFGPMKATRLFGIIPLTHESGLISVLNEKRFLEVQFRMTRTLLDFMATLHKNGHDERVLSKAVKIFIDGDIVTLTIKFIEDGQYGLDIYTRDQQTAMPLDHQAGRGKTSDDPGRQMLTHCCKYLINVKSTCSLLSSPAASKQVQLQLPPVKNIAH